MSLRALPAENLALPCAACTCPAPDSRRKIFHLSFPRFAVPLLGLGPLLQPAATSPPILRCFARLPFGLCPLSARSSSGPLPPENLAKSLLCPSPATPSNRHAFPTGKRGLTHPQCLEKYFGLSTKNTSLAV